MAAANATPAVLLALGANAALAAALFSAYAATGASAVLATATHALIGASCLALLFFACRQAPHAPSRARDAPAPAELHFWSFVAPISLLSMGADLCVYAGVERLREPRHIVDPHLAYATLGLSAAVVGLAIWSVVSAFDAAGWRVRSFAARRAAHEPALLSVLIQSLAILTSVAVALGSMFASEHLAIAGADGFGTLAIGAAMAATASLLPLEIRRRLAIAESHGGGTPTIPAAPEVQHNAALGVADARNATGEPLTIRMAAPSDPPAPSHAAANASHSHPSRKSRKKSKHTSRK